MMEAVVLFGDCKFVVVYTVERQRSSLDFAVRWVVSGNMTSGGWVKVRMNSRGSDLFAYVASMQQRLLSKLDSVMSNTWTVPS